jgi:uncharacterized protein YhfF
VNVERPALWELYRIRCGLPEDAPFRVRRLGDDPRLCRLILGVIRRREKTGTFTPVAFFSAPGESLPLPGEHYVLTDPEGRADCVVRLTATAVKPLDAITEEDLLCEGEALRRLDAWKRLHCAYWKEKLVPFGLVPDGDLPILCQRFELVAIADA